MSLPDYNNAYDFSTDSIGSVYLTGAGYTNYEIKGASPDSPYGWQEFVWAKSPTRSKNFKFSNMDTIDVGLVARCEINVKYMNYNDYCVVRKILNRERYFMVKFFDCDDKKWVTREMYCSENNKSKFFTLDKKLVGAVDMAIKFVGTNNDLEEFVTDSNGVVSSNIIKFTVSYSIPSGSGTTPESKEVAYSEQVQLAGSSGIIAPSGKHLAGWITKDGNTITGYYGLNQKITVWEDLTLYPNFQNA